jgi:transposase InsO family protein
METVDTLLLGLRYSPLIGQKMGSTSDAREKIEFWRQEYNAFRPHSSLGGPTPDEVGKDVERRINERPILNL